ncbi:ABC-2 type transport system permease protein [Murinocardiopsis flavida]|uniref:Transport permease protein n=1 Tax=Murinocardiopsis flavida TaxID=645275 RepID=A0A2P8DQ86_9ACTN|nr:ABC transporter permease [Murinocardiopsis flavida]PSK99383.1 ABC-2 type transport system permease protein [Murinocardiopsis flavida]
MTTLTASPRLRGFGTLTATQGRLFLRDTGSVVFAIAFPPLLVIGIGLALPGMRAPITDLPEPWAGMPAIHLFAPVALALAVATVALSTLPSQIVAERELGVLRRMATTPMRPQGVLVAQVLVNLCALVAACVLAIAAGALVFGTPAPVAPVAAALAFVLGAAATAGVGLLIAALAPKASAANGIGMLVYFPMLFFAGMWTPGPTMPDTVAAIARFTPLGAMSQALNAAWFEGGFPAAELVVMAAYIAVLYPLAARLFRWS